MCSAGGEHLTGNQDGLTSRLSEGKLAFPYLCFHAIRRDVVFGRGGQDMDVWTEMSLHLCESAVFSQPRPRHTTFRAGILQP